MVILYVVGMSEDIRRVCKTLNITVIFKVWADFPLNVDTLPLGKQSDNYDISYPLQLRPCLHRGDQTKAGDETEGKPRCLQEGMMERLAVA